MRVRDLERHIRHSLRGQGEFSAVEIGNAAGQTLCNAHAWNWLIRLSEPLGTTAGQSYIDLPPARQILEVQAKGAGGYRAILGPRELTAARDWGGTWSTLAGSFGVMVSYRSGTNGLPQRILELAPVPDETVADAFRIWFHGDWTALVDDGSEVGIPPWLEPVYLECVRAFAHGWQFPEQGTPSDILARLYAGPLWRDALNLDGELAAPLGTLTRWTLDDSTLLQNMSQERTISG